MFPSNSKRDNQCLHSLPLPTDKQYTAFAEHVCGAHSWYKHLPLLTGAEFVFFLAPDAGEGFSVEHPRLHYSWHTTAEYRQRFGCLDYMRRVDTSAPFERDIPQPVSISAELILQCSARLHPYLSCDCDPQEVPLYDIHRKDFERLHAGKNCPDRALLLEWHRSATLLQEIWQYRLTTQEHDVLCSDEIAEISAITASPAVNAYLECKRSIDTVYSRLHKQEMTRVRSCLERLQAWTEK